MERDLQREVLYRSASDALNDLGLDRVM